MKKIQPTRRSFIKTTLAAGVAPIILPSGLFGADAPSKKITVGCIGVGGHGTGHNLRAYLKQVDARVVMVCDVDSKRMERAKKMVDSFYRDSGKGCATTKDFREVLARPDIDAVMISTPDHWHTLMSVLALRSGKDVQLSLIHI